MKTLAVEPITVWQALSLLGASNGGTPMSEARARRALRQIGMKKSEMDQPYPEEAIGELLHLIEHPECLEKTVKEATEWTISRN
jgi:hypothetical protein